MFDTLHENFQNPPIDCWPHTRWWWMGNAVTKEEITWELEQMYEKGIGGVEQITMSPVYEKGNIPFLSDEFFDMIKHTVQTAKRLGMHVSLNFGGPGWVIGYPGVPQEDRSKNLVPTSIDIEGPQLFSGPLPTKLKKGINYWWEIRTPDIGEDDLLLAVVAGKIVEGQIDEQSIVVLTSNTNKHNLEWQVPEGKWRLMAFWLKYTGQGHALDHFSESAMRRYCDELGGMFYNAVGDEFGKTVDSLFCDSFEVAFAPGGIYWSDGLLDEFKKRKGYDLAPYLPAIWWDIGDLTPRIRYDVNEFSHQIGLEAFFIPFLEWCEAHNIKGRIQAYGFSTDIIQGSGITHIPEQEVTAGEKDAVPWFDTRIGPKKLVTSGAHLYGRNIVTTEAYTYLHWEPYRATLEELKIASDIFLRTGANKFYNAGYSFSPERDVAPSRWFGAAVHISHDNIWWDYYPLLSKYVARCCYLLRQGRFVADVALYSPLASQWTTSALNARRWNRDFEWGELGKLLVANGYDFDVINDDILQNHAQIADGTITVRDLEYRIVILPNIEAMPLKTLQFFEEYARKGGVVIALERVPEYSVGLIGHEERDREVKRIVSDMFTEPSGMNGTGPKEYGEGKTYHIKLVIDRSDILDRRSSALDPFVNTLRDHIPPDFGIDFALEGIRENDGLTFMHRQVNNTDIYFVTNVQDRPSDIPLTFRIKNAVPWNWNPYNGEASQILHYRNKEHGTEIPVHLAPYESTFVIFQQGDQGRFVEQTNLYEVLSVEKDEIEALASENGIYQIRLSDGDKRFSEQARVGNIPAPFRIGGEWKMTLEAPYFPRVQQTFTHLISWTEDPATESFSGTGRYEIEFDLPSDYVSGDLILELDLGKVGNIAEVQLNGTPIGVSWMRGQKLDITKAVHAGKNNMVILVTNTLINRVSHFKEPPPVPESLVPHFGSGKTGISADQRGPIGFKPLPASGLLGPVKIYALKRVKVGRE
ncbi:MAG: glycosyl hydrolase [bacterium]